MAAKSTADVSEDDPNFTPARCGGLSFLNWRDEAESKSRSSINL
jgi:hypothetical protein